MNQGIQTRDKTESGSVRQRLIWLLVFRAIVMAVLLVFSILVTINDPRLLISPAQVFLYIAAGFSFFVILIGALWQRFAAGKKLGLQILLQQVADIVVGVLLVFATGGLESTFVFWFSLTTINGAALAYRQGAVLSAAGGSLGLALLSLLSFKGIGAAQTVEAMPLATAIRFFLFNVSALFIVALLSSYLSEQLRQTGRQLIAAQDDLSRLESLHAAVLSSLTSGLLVVDARDQLSFINRAGAALLGLDPDNVKNLSIRQIAPALFDALSSSDLARSEVQIRVDDRERIFGCSSSPLLLQGRETGGQVLTFQDLTELRQLEEAMARSKRMASMGRFAAGLAHELRNPLASLSGCVELLGKAEQNLQQSGDLQSTMTAEQKQKLFAIVLRESERLNRLLSDFLRYARPNKPLHRPLLLNHLVRDILTVAEGDLRNVRCELDLQQDLRIRGDEDQLKQLVWNLLRNALQAMEKTGRLRATVRRKEDESAPGKQFVEFCIEDAGPGIDAEARDKIFDPFYTTRSDGTGLGLPTVLRIAEEHQAQLAVDESELGGAAFHVRFLLLEDAQDNGAMVKTDQAST